jgi:2-iminobutanoate/2-iminopropanoate deaminase
MHQAVFSASGPKPRGPYSPAVITEGTLVFVSAQGPFDPRTGEIVAPTFEEQAVQVFENVTALLQAADATWQDVVKVQVFLADFANFDVMNAVYAQYVSEPYPARTTVHSQIGQALIAVDCIAALRRA